jgi:hypothetical protein
MANQNPLEFDRPFTMRANEEFHDQLEAIRRTRDPIPTKAELIRALVAAEFIRVSGKAGKGKR